MKRVMMVAVMIGVVLSTAARATSSEATEPPPVQRVDLTTTAARKAAAANETIRQVMKAAKPTIGVPYRWGGTSLEKGIDCSNYTWQLYRKIGMHYGRFLSTRSLARVTDAHGLRQVSFEDAVPGDLLVYGYRDGKKRWHGHVVILVDKDGKRTGHKGLVLGAHGGDIDAVRFVTFTGYEDGHFKSPEMRLCNVLRVDPNPPPAETAPADADQAAKGTNKKVSGGG